MQKAKNAFEPANYRLVVLFSIWYRLWSSMQSRHYFTQLERLANFPAFGFLTGRGCSDLTYAVQVPIEEALGQRRDLCGGLTLKSVLTYTQESGDVLGPLVWRTPFLRQMHRAFRVRHEPSDAVHSSCGLPGGDGHSCVGMILLDFSFHLYMQHFQPGINELSFVDSLQLISTCPGGLTAGVGTLETWADLFRLRIDSRKTQYWALKSQHRQLLLSFGLPVVECTSDLGATMQYSAKHLNRPFQQRILQPLPFWTKLRKLSLSPWFKLLAIKVALLPRALHASCSVFLGDSWFVKLRTQVMRATRVSRAGANPIFCERPSCLVLMWILVFMMLGTLLGCFFTTTRPTLRSGRYGHVLFKPLVPDEHMGPLQSC